MSAYTNYSISANYTEADKGSTPTTSDLVEVFRDRVDTWQLAVAEEMLWQIENPSAFPKMEHAAYGLISVVFSYFELVGQFVKTPGTRTGATEDFVAGFIDVYSAWKGRKVDIEAIYDRIRCGMFHNAYTKLGVIIDGGYTVTFEIRNGNVYLNPHMLVRDLRTHFTGLTTRLENTANADLRKNLEDLMNRQPKK
jgi:hypothetical protein